MYGCARRHNRSWRAGGSSELVGTNLVVVNEGCRWASAIGSMQVRLETTLPGLVVFLVCTTRVVSMCGAKDAWLQLMCACGPITSTAGGQAQSAARAGEKEMSMYVLSFKTWVRANFEFNQDRL